jgi:FkbM family methyltransferase
MDECSGESVDLRSLDANRMRVIDRIEVRSQVTFSATIDQRADDPISLELAAGRFPESTRAAIEYLQASTPRAGRVLDLGTHVGTFTLAAAAMGYEVIGVEASPENASLLRASLERNGFDRVQLVNAAVSDRPGTLEFSQGGPYGHVGVREAGQASVSVPAIRIDDLVAERGWERVDFIKMDIEGSEIAGLQGMARLLSADDAPTIFVESNGHTLDFFNESPDRLKSLLEGYAYQSYLVEPGRLCPVQANDFQPITCVDYLALKRPATTLEGCRIDRPLTFKELVVRIVHSAHSPHVAERRYIARTLAQAAPEIRASKRVHQAVELLRRDSCTEVRDAARAISLEPARSDWLVSWHRGLDAIRNPFDSRRARKPSRSGAAHR